MTKQEEVREGIERILDELLFSPGESKDGYTYNLTGCITNLLNYLHSQGVVKRVKCPDCTWSQVGNEAVGMTPCYRCNSSGYITEPLIEE